MLWTAILVARSGCATNCYEVVVNHRLEDGILLCFPVRSFPQVSSRFQCQIRNSASSKREYCTQTITSSPHPSRITATIPQNPFFSNSNQPANMRFSIIISALFAAVAVASPAPAPAPDSLAPYDVNLSFPFPVDVHCLVEI
jgi:hypothetical protein